MLEYHVKGELDEDQAVAWLNELAANLRKSDLDEIKASSGVEPDLGMIIGYLRADIAWIGVANGKPVIVFGLEGECCWMLAAPAIERSPLSRQIGRDTKRFVDEMQARSSLIYNWVDLRNVRSLRWLLWAGFKVTDINMNHGVEKRPFFKIIRTTITNV